MTTWTLAGQQARPGPNDVLDCATDSARRRHLALGQECPTCQTWWDNPPAFGATVAEFDPEGAA